jgi:hypothetical protein
MTNAYKRMRLLLWGNVARAAIFLVGAGVGIASVMLPSVLGACKNGDDPAALVDHGEEIPPIGNGYIVVETEEKDKAWSLYKLWDANDTDQQENAGSSDPVQWINGVEEWCKRHSRVVSGRTGIQFDTRSVVARVFKIKSGCTEGAVFCLGIEGVGDEPSEVFVAVYEYPRE